MNKYETYYYVQAKYIHLCDLYICALKVCMTCSAHSNDSNAHSNDAYHFTPTPHIVDDIAVSMLKFLYVR